VAIHLGIVGLPSLVADLVAAAFAPRDDVEVELITAPSSVRLEDVDGRPRHDVIIAGVDDPWQASAASLLSRRPDLVLIGFGQGGRDPGSMNCSRRRGRWPSWASRCCARPCSPPWARPMLRMT